MGKGRRRSCLGSVEPFRDKRLVFPVYPDEFGKREESLGGLVFFFSVSKAWTSSEAVAGVSSWVAFELSENKTFLLDREKVLQCIQTWKLWGEVSMIMRPGLKEPSGCL